MSDPTQDSPDVPDAPDPQEVTEQPGYVPPAEDPTDPEVTDPADPSYVEPMGGVSMTLAPIIPGDGAVTA